jgi:hypothetical protein
MLSSKISTIRYYLDNEHPMPLSELAGPGMAAIETRSAEEVQRAMIERRTADLGADHLSTLKSMLKLGETLKRRHGADTECLLEAKGLFMKVLGGFGKSRRKA